MKRIMWSVALLLVVGSQPVWARMRIHDAAESAVYKTKMGGMLGRGALNVITSPVDVVTNVVNETKAGPPFVGTLTGLGKGLGCGVLRLGSGAVDIVTFWVPGFNGFPVSDSYEDCLAGPAVSASTNDAESVFSQAATQWEVPTDEPVAAQLPLMTDAQPAPKKVWKK